MTIGLSDGDIQRVDNILKRTEASCTPIFVKPDGRPSAESGYVDGTLTLVGAEGRVFAVTAEHVIRRNTDKLVYSPILPGWRMKSLRDYDWRSISQTENAWEPYFDIDLVLAELSPSEIYELDPNRIFPVYPSHVLEKPFIAVVRGYLKKKHRRSDIQIKEMATTTSYAIESNGITTTIRPPHLHPDPPTHIKFPFDRKHVQTWRHSEINPTSGSAPQPNGLSGGPIIYCGDKHTTSNQAPAPCVIGFLIEQSDRNRTITAVAADVLFSSVRPSPKQDKNRLNDSILRIISTSQV